MTPRRFGMSGDRVLAVAVLLMVTVALAGVVSRETAASFTGTSTNPANHLNSLLVQPPASQNATTSSAAGVVNLSWTASPTVAGAGHTLSYDVLRGPVGGPYTLLATTSALAYSDTPPADGSYGYVIRAKVAGVGTFTSGDSAAQTGVSDSTPPTSTIACNSAACTGGWYNAAVSVTVSGADAGTGMGSVTRNVDAGGQVSTAGASASFTVTGESAGHTVQYFTTDAAGNASTTAMQMIKIDTTAPTPATALLAVTGSSGAPVTVDLTWTPGTDALSGVQGYEVRWTNNVAACPAATAANYPNAATVGAVTSYQLASPAAGDKHCAYVVTIDNAGNRSAASAVSGPTKSK